MAAPHQLSTAARAVEDIQRELVRHSHDHPPVRDLNLEGDRRLGRAGRTALDLAKLVGSWTFVLLQAVLVVAWLALNVARAVYHWDPDPFQLLSLVMATEAVLFLAIALMAIKHLYERDRLRAQREYEQDVKAEEELKMLMTHLEVQDGVLLQILHRLDRTDRDVRKMARRMGIGEDPQA